MSPEAARFLRFLATGAVNTGFGYASYAALVLTGLPLWLAVTGSTGMAILFNFYSYGGMVFGDTSARVLPRFLVFYAALGLVNFGLLHLLTSLGIGPLLAQALLLPVLAVLGFAGMRLFVFTAQSEKAG
jgi:putative flippase GtrA